MYLFSYGSNHPLQLGDRIGRTILPEDIIAGKLCNHKIAYVGHSYKWRGAIATVKRSRAVDVLGYLTDLSKEELAIIDTYEGVKTGFYRRSKRTIQTMQGPLKAIVYICNNEDEGYPSEDYRKAVSLTRDTYLKYAFKDLV
jgi:gamma-glutamylcyclotransferase (GGCT)/AIG2-like uncharacterized protein YtfP